MRSDCGGGNFSGWISTTFSAYCIPTAGGSSTSYYLNNITTTGGTTNISYTASTYSPYVNATSQSISQSSSGTYGISLASAGSNTYYYLRVDWNDDLDFLDANELVVNQNSYVATYSNSSLVVPATAPIGPHRMRVTTAEISMASTVTCGPNNYGNYVDFVFNVTIPPPPSCIANPGNPVNGGSACIGSVSLNWAAASYATMYDVYFDAGTTATTLRSANQSTLTYSPGALVTGAGTYAWKIIPKNASGDATGCSTWTFTVNDPQISGTTPDSRCGPGPVTLSATSSSGTIKWYANATGGTALATGPSFTPNITGPTTFYVAAQTGGGGPASLNLMPLAGGNGCGGGNMLNITNHKSRRYRIYG